MRLPVHIIFIIAFGSVDATSAVRCTRAIKFCNITDVITGVATSQEYNDCSQICCGGGLVERDVNLQCCGTQEKGEVYNTDTQICCQWSGASDSGFAVYNKTGKEDAFCCGIALFTQDMYQNQTCCNGWLNRPAPFFYRTEMCCNGNVQFSGDTAYTSCCGDLAYDRRVASCPCHDGNVGVGIPKEHAGCCRGTGSAKSPYNMLTQGCCNGQAYDKDSRFCCGGLVGETATELCCTNSIVAREPDQTGANLACCGLLDGTNVVFNNDRQICCGNAVQSRTTNEQDEVCCGDTIYNKTISGESCCNGVPFFASASACCNNSIKVGDSCCGDFGYNSKEQVCCGGGVSPTSFKYASCCVNQTFDSYEQTCCGTTVFNNPLIPSGVEGEFTVSHTTRCCGDFSDSRTLLPYDYMTATCCNGNIVDYGGMDRGSSDCCGDTVIDRNQYVCCDGVALERLFADKSACCNGSTINSTDTICCQGNQFPRNEKTVCCGNSAMDSTLFKCCGDVARSLNGVPPEKAICCGNGCIDGTLFFCCDGKQYSKGASEGVDVTGLSCSQLFPDTP